jgi:hypothetical protein
VTITRRLAIIVVSIGIIAAACGDDDASILITTTTTIAADATTTTKVPDTAAVTTTVADAGTTTTKPPAETTTTTTAAPTTTTTFGLGTLPTITVPLTLVTLVTLPPAVTIPAATLNPFADANYGNKTAAAGFVPDPISYAASAGGSVNVSYLGGSCVGYATSAPDFDFEWTGSDFTNLRFFFSPDDGVSDPVLIINGPDGTWFCSDDYLTSRSPLIDFPTSPNGHYDIWVGTYGSGGGFPGRLYITEGLFNPVDPKPPGD